MFRITHRFTVSIVVWLGFAASSLASDLSASTQPAPLWNARFQSTEGWIGADAVYTAALPDGRIAWLFNDTFVGRIENGARKDVKLVNNTLAVSRSDGSELKFHIRRSASGEATNWLASAHDHEWYWPNAAVQLEGRLHVFCQRVSKTKDEGAFGFRVWGTDLLSLELTEGEPLNWPYTAQSVVSSGADTGPLVTWGAAVLTDNPWIYVYGTRDRQQPLSRKELLLARTTATTFTQPSQWTYFDGVDWAHEPPQARRLIEGATNELSVHYDGVRQQFVALHSGEWLAPTIERRYAPRPWGPWSTSEVIYRCPEAEWDRRVFCYAAKAQPLLSGENELLISYCTNSKDFWHTLQDARLYWPQFVTLSPSSIR